ncbi:SDR family NAD(P)-dependent oxidoreductase [Nocardioides albus]|uniref:NAD(P)-dependent dehydrogenase (Short-subunit alcohol dehydrogenase family) n=1 Tax=Nocardioides albus TaxID=1841 RepID=A0A7W5F9J9_9ACTN|nr:SDR family oxidoreductase [Nocardioides albus]MBB3090102.1 NAD(P)-dependent dehydrogenase (short-subunit alcohol dehydrogenase family) [Nocardioides albus]GGU27718.1 alcohol dehydrogenase [Nocardioides albus]
MPGVPPSSRGTVLVTGAAGGIGEAICRRLAETGGRLVLAYRSRKPDTLLDDLGSRIVFADSCDLADAADVARFVRAALQEAGDIRTVVHAAGPHVPMTHLSRIAPEELDRQLREDVSAFFNLAHAVLPSLRRTRGSVTAITTAATSRYPVRDGLSAAPKAAVEALARALAAEEGRYGVRVNCVGPGMLDDGMAARLIASGDLDQRALDVTLANIPLRTFGTSTDIAEAVEFLSSDRARFITGQKLDVDGGYSV